MNIGRIDINFTIINDYDPKFLHIGDLSSWLNAENLPASICITPPGSRKVINTVFAKHKINSFTSTNLGLSCIKECDEQELVELSDGIWTIVLKSGYEGIEKTMYYLKTDSFQQKIDEIYIRAGLEFDKNQKKFREDLQDIHFMLASSHAQIRRGDYTKSSRDFKEAQEILKKYSACKDCM